MCRPPNRKLHPCLAKSWKSEIQQMRSAIPAQKRSERNAPTAGFNCAKIMWKPVADVMRSSVRGEGRASVHDTTYDPLVEQNRCQVGPTILFECPAQDPRPPPPSFFLWAPAWAISSAQINLGLPAVDRKRVGCGQDPGLGSGGGNDRTGRRGPG